MTPAGGEASAETAPQALAAATPDAYHQGVPAYMTEVYDWAYVNPRKARWLDHDLLVKLLLFGNDQRLMRAYLDEIAPGDKVWQLAHVYGDLVVRAADRVGSQGLFHLTDVTPVQIEHARAKLAARPWAQALRCDAADYTPDASAMVPAPRYDVICSFFLLHEVPDAKKAQIVNRALDLLPPGGKAIFVDYHGPARWQPVRYILKLVNRYLEPFANALWQREISSFADHPERFDWHKRCYFGGVYQCVIARHRLGAGAAS